jgi:hypothetical protein
MNVEVKSMDGLKGANKKEHTSKEDDWMLTRVVSSHDEVPRGMRCGG